MSGSVATADGLDRTQSLDTFSSIDHISILTNGEATHPTEIAGFRVGELSLPNGESYSGSLLGNVPEGQGKYVWSDGCVYDGEWRRGMRNGLGKIQWPSGVSYEGEFSGGYIHGTGTYIGPENLTYKGRWRFNLKHGLGYQVYPNGDIFEGSWIQGTPEGPGKYTWANGNVYLGNMKGGTMSGKGTLTWVSGDSFEGSWLNGMMHGLGAYTWGDGGCYVGTWTRGLKDGKGTFYPKGSCLPSAQEIYLNALRKRGLLPDLRKQNQVHIHNTASVDIGNVKAGENRRSSGVPSGTGNLLNLDQSRSKNISLERRWSLEVAIEKVIGHDSQFSSTDSIFESGSKEVNEKIPILEREYMQGVLISEVVLNSSFASLNRRAKQLKKKIAREIKRPGEQIIKGHRSYDLMLRLQLGIR
jgi:1-phosphatidylinositol-4-phosphate 5-kinase